MTLIEQQIKDLYYKFSVYSSFVYLNTPEMISEIVSVINSVKDEVTVIDRDTIIITAAVVPGHQTTSTGLIIMQEQPIRLFFIRTLKHYECNEFCRLVINIKNPILKYIVMSNVIKLQASTHDLPFHYDTIDLSTYPTKKCSLENTIGLCGSITYLHHDNMYEKRDYFISESDNNALKYNIRTGRRERKSILESVVSIGYRITRSTTILVDCNHNLDSLSIVLDYIPCSFNVVLNVYLVNIGERMLSNRLILNTKDNGQTLKGLTINYILGGFKSRFFNRSEKTQSLLYIECTESNRHLFRDNENVKVNIYSYNYYDTFFMYNGDHDLVTYEESPELYQLSPVNDDTIAVNNLAIKVNHEVGGMDIFKDYLTKNPNIKCY